MGAEGEERRGGANARWRLLPPPPLPRPSTSVSPLSHPNPPPPGDSIHLLHVIPIPAPEIIGGVGMGGPGDFVISDPDPAKDRAALAKAEAFIATRFCPVLEAQKAVEWKAEVVHFATDADSVAAIVEARALKLGATAVVLAKHAGKSKLKQLLLGSTAKHLVSSCPVPVVVLHAA